MSDDPNYDDLSQGGKANRQGDQLHKEILRIIAAHEFVQVRLYSEGSGAVAELPRHTRELLFAGGRVFSEYPALCEGLFGSPHYPNFLLFDRRWPEPLALIPRHQSSSGSARDKLPLIAETIQERYPCPCLLVLEGPFMSGDPRVMRWAYHRAERSNGRLRRVFAGAYEFRQWMITGAAFPEAAPASLL
jgi:hypothetical protein